MVRRVTALAGTLAVLLLVLAPSAFAANLGTAPDDDGDYAHCKVVASFDGTPDNSFSMKCQYGPTDDATPRIKVELQTSSTTFASFDCTAGSNCGGGINGVASAGKFRFDYPTFSFSAHAIDEAICTYYEGGSTTRQCAVDSFTNSHGSATYPFDYYSGGSQGDHVSGEDDPEDVDEETSCTFIDVVCWLRKLFVPDGDAIGDKIHELNEAATDHWPLGPVFDATTRFSELSEEASGEVDGDNPQGLVTDRNESNDCTHLSLPLNFGENFDAPDNTALVETLPACPDHRNESGDTFGAFFQYMQWFSWYSSLALAAIATIFIIYNAANKTVAD